MNPTELPGWRWVGGMFASWTDTGGTERGAAVVSTDPPCYLRNGEAEALPTDAQPHLSDPATGGCITEFMTNLYLTMGPDRHWSIEDDEVEVTSHASLGEALFHLAQTRGEWA